MLGCASPNGSGWMAIPAGEGPVKKMRQALDRRAGETETPRPQYDRCEPLGKDVSHGDGEGGLGWW